MDPWKWWRGFWRDLFPGVDPSPFSPSATFEYNFIDLAAQGPVDVDGQRGGRHMDQPLAEVTGRWSNCRVYIDCPQSFSTADNVLFTLWGRANGVWTILAEAPVSAMALQAYAVAATVPRQRGMGLGASGTACSSFRVTARCKTGFKGTPELPTGRVEMELWGTESPYGFVQGALGASSSTGGYEDRPIEPRGAQLMGYNRGAGVWFPVEVNGSGQLSIAPVVAAAPTRSVQNGQTHALIITGLHELVSVDASNTSGAQLFLQLFNEAASPVNTDRPDYEWVVPNNAAVDFANFDGDRFLLGIGFAWSTTSGSLTLPLAGTGLFATVKYRP